MEAWNKMSDAISIQPFTRPDAVTIQKFTRPGGVERDTLRRFLDSTEVGDLFLWTIGEWPA